MGLAASQARLLLLTARKDDIDAQLMSIANQKLSISRDSAEVSSEYQNALNATKLTFDTPDGSQDLTYDLLMRPNTANDAAQYILTDTSSGKVLLDNGYLSALGLAQTGGKGDIANMSYTTGGTTYTGEQAFLMSLMGCNATDAQGFIDTSGSAALNPTNETYISYDTAAICTKALGLGVYSTSTEIDSKSDSGGWWGLFGDGADSSIGNSSIVSKFDTVLKSMTESIGSALTDYLGDYLPSNIMNKLPDAFFYAYQATFNKFVYNIDDQNTKDGVQIPSDKDPVWGSGDCNNQTQICVNEDRNGCGGFLGSNPTSTTTVTVDNSTLAETFLTYFDRYCAENFGGECKSKIENGKLTREAKGGTGNMIDNTGAEVGEGDFDKNTNNLSDSYEACFYIRLFNALMQYGWTSSGDVSNEDYVQSQVMNGNITIKEFAGKETWANISTSSSDSPLGTERDEDAIAKAKAEYDTEKDLLDNKEAELEIKMNDLDTERTAITTEIESVNNLIKNNIDSSFKMFDA